MKQGKEAAITSEIRKDLTMLRESQLALESKIAERLNALEKLEIDLKRSNRELDQFVFIASHNLQEPIQTIEGFLNLLLSKKADILDEESQQYLNYISNATQEIKVLIREFLRYSMIGRIGIADRYEARLLIGNAIDQLEALKNKTAAKIMLPDDLPEIYGVKEELEELFFHIIHNSMTYHKPGNFPEISIGVAQKEKYWEFSVKDNGIGIDPKYSDRVFGMFQRLHKHEVFPGMGIGLAMCRKIVERYGGEIWLNSEYANGACFYFTLPITQ